MRENIILPSVNLRWSKNELGSHETQILQFPFGVVARFCIECDDSGKSSLFVEIEYPQSDTYDGFKVGVYDSAHLARVAAENYIIEELSKPITPDNE